MKSLLRSLSALSGSCLPSIILAAGGAIPGYQTNGWSSPVNYQSTESCYQFGQYSGHVGADLCRDPYTSVVAIADGCVEDFSDSLSGYGGTGGEKGGAILLRHRTETGRPFYVVYGHVTFNTGYLNERRCEGGSTLVKQADEIGQVGVYVGGANHLHIGIHPDTIAQRKYQGYECFATDNCGWVQPFEFLMKYRPQMQCDLSKMRCDMKVNGPIGWFPAVADCQQASQWFRLVKDDKNKVSRIESAEKSACPLVCYAN